MTVMEWIGTFPKFNGGREGIKPGLDRMNGMLALLKHPHQQLNFIHVAGTNGKGSTCAFLAAIFEAAGLRVGLYTSPYLMSFHDRMRVNGVPITDDQLEIYCKQLQPVVEEVEQTDAGKPTEFELVTALSLLYFADQKPDIVIWETGLGGRLDATNVVTPIISVITNIGLDHQHILGATEAEIALEKAGIIKPFVPVVTGAEGISLEVMIEKAKLTRSRLFVYQQDFHAKNLFSNLQSQCMNYISDTLQLGEVTIHMLGEHQIKNASLAIITAEYIGMVYPEWKITSDIIRKGLFQSKWPGRFEVIHQDPLVILDGAHNPHGIKALVQTVEQLLGGRRLTVVVGILQDKALPEILLPIANLASRLILTKADTPRSAEPQDLLKIVEQVDIQVNCSSNIREAMELAWEKRSEDEVILVTGTLFLISEARIWYYEQNVSALGD